MLKGWHNNLTHIHATFLCAVAKYKQTYITGLLNMNKKRKSFLSIVITDFP